MDFVEALCERISSHDLESAEITRLLKTAGPKLLWRLTRTRSLREVARRSGYSPTYLSGVRSGNVSISPDAFVALAELLGKDGR